MCLLFHEGGLARKRLCAAKTSVQRPPGSTNFSGKRRCRQVRVKIVLACTECKQRNYLSKKEKKNNPDRLEMNKYCRFCRKHTLHRETK